MRKLILSLSSVIVLAGFGGDGRGTAAVDAGGAATAERLDCGSTRADAKRAVRTFVSVLRAGDQDRILAVLAKRQRFEWITVARANRSWIVRVIGNRRRAAKAIAARGGLPLRIDRFINADKPHGTTGFGFVATWKGQREAVGKAALDCNSGTARVLSVALRPR